MFTNQKLKQLIIPLVIEQILAVLVGMADIMMVSSVSEAAVSGVSLVDSISILIINIFAALATGGAVVAAQYLGRREEEQACFSAKQLILCTTAISAVIMVMFLIFGRQLIALIFGKVDPEVLASAQTYLFITSMSYPFIALYNSCAALYRAMGNSRISMVTSLIMNSLNIVGNAILIYGLGMGVEGAAIPTLISRIVCAVLIVVMLRHRQDQIRLDSYFHLGFDWTMIKRILQIGIPNGLENGMFQIGKILVQSLVAMFGTASIAANAVANNFASMEVIPAAAIGLGLVTVVGQCVGAGKIEEARYYTKKLMKWAYMASIALNVCILLGANVLLKLYNLSPETLDIAFKLLFIHGFFVMVIWPVSFTLPNALRAANDARFTMSVSIASMWICRIGLSYVFGLVFELGVVGVWLAMICDWFVRSAFFVVRFRGDRWTRRQLIEG